MAGHDRWRSLRSSSAYGAKHSAMRDYGQIEPDLYTDLHHRCYVTLLSNLALGVSNYRKCDTQALDVQLYHFHLLADVPYEANGAEQAWNSSSH